MLHIRRLIERRIPEHAGTIIGLLCIASGLALVIGVSLALR